MQVVRASRQQRPDGNDGERDDRGATPTVAIADFADDQCTKGHATQTPGKHARKIGLGDGPFFDERWRCKSDRLNVDAVEHQGQCRQHQDQPTDPTKWCGLDHFLEIYRRHADPSS